MDNGNARFCEDVLDIELIVIMLFLRVEVHLDVDLKTRIEVGTLEFLTQACWDSAKKQCFFLYVFMVNGSYG